MSDEKKGSEQLSVDARLAKLQQRRMGTQQDTPTQPQTQVEGELPQTATEEASKESLAKPEPEPPALQTLTWQRAGQPSSHDRRSKVPFNDRYFKDNVMVDKRLLPYYLHWLEQCRSKVEGANKMLLEFLISKGYQIDPHLLDWPFRWEDVPQPPEE